MYSYDKNFNVFKIFLTPFHPDLVSGILWELELNGIIEEENFISIYADTDSNVTLQKIEKLLNRTVAEGLLEKFLIEKEIVKNENWNEIWEKSREIIHATDKIVIRPSFKKYSPKPGEIVLTIDPKMSFGTGEHQSTQLVLQLLEKYVKPGIKVLDVGSGTGILSIAALKLGAASAFAVDNDELCYDNCKENAELNSVMDFMKIITGDVKDIIETNFDLVIANIQKNILLEITGEIKNKIRQNGILILSGLLKEDETEIKMGYSVLEFTFLEKSIKDDWISLVFNFKG